MTSKTANETQRTEIWSRLSAPLPEGVVAWRQDGAVVSRDGRFFARFVAYVEANTVRERLDEVVPGEWDLTLDLLPPLPTDGSEDQSCSFKSRLQILGVTREDVGTGRDYKAAATDAFKRAAVRFGVAHELYALEQNWVQMDGDGPRAKPVEDPAAAYARRYHASTRAQGRTAIASQPAGHGATEGMVTLHAGDSDPEVDRALGEADARIPPCPRCGGRMWDNRLNKRNPRAPDFKCRDRSCDGVVWPARESPAEDQGGVTGEVASAGGSTPRSRPRRGRTAPLMAVEAGQGPAESGDEGIPF